MITKKKMPLEERFWLHTQKSGDDDCWIWKGSIKQDGYGVMTRMGKKILAHRFSYSLHNGEITDKEMCVCHKCDIPLCVNPKHLWLGTKSENSIDRNLKGRTAKGFYHSRNTIYYSKFS